MLLSLPFNKIVLLHPGHKYIRVINKTLPAQPGMAMSDIHLTRYKRHSLHVKLKQSLLAIKMKCQLNFNCFSRYTAIHLSITGQLALPTIKSYVLIYIGYHWGPLSGKDKAILYIC